MIHRPAFFLSRKCANFKGAYQSPGFLNEIIEVGFNDLFY